ncbi:hypothetical protein ACFL1H_01210 [Nanoarchaeota archaeon]
MELFRKYEKYLPAFLRKKHEKVLELTDYNFLAIEIIGDGLIDAYRLKNNPKEFRDTPDLDKFKDSIVDHLKEDMGYEEIHNKSYNLDLGRSSLYVEIIDLSNLDSKILMYVETESLTWPGYGTDFEKLKILFNSDNYMNIIQEIETVYPKLKLFNKKLYTNEQIIEMYGKIEIIKREENGYRDTERKRLSPTSITVGFSET